MVAGAVALRPHLLARAMELTDGHAADAEDLVSDTYLKFVEKPPVAQSPSRLKNWLRTVLRNRWIDGHRRQEADVVSLEELLANRPG